ncbi:MAG TPA: CPBP family intramembrane glutamic endopeptidase [Anaerolineales bacterium]|nr:CPBP family intramembrane glutamic endopeptidase [Anaerolineales bacterium]
MEEKQVNWKRVGLYILFAYGIAWLTGLVIYLRGGLFDSPEIVPGSGITEATILLATGYMFAPAISHILTRLVTREGWKNIWLKANLKIGWPYWLAGWFGTAALILLSAVLYFLIFPKYFDPSMAALKDMITQQEAVTGQPMPFSISTFVALQIGLGILISPIANLVPVLGEEFGWRAYLQPKLLPLGRRKALLLTGLIWGFWHAPVIAMGHNYGLEYPGAPWTGILVFTLVPVAYSVFFGWAALQARSVWPAVIGHSVLNGLAAAVIFFVQGEPNPLLGPTAAGLIGSVGFTLVAILILQRPGQESAQSELEETAV